MVHDEIDDDSGDEDGEPHPAAVCVVCGEYTSSRCAPCGAAICPEHAEPCPNGCDGPPI